MLHASAGAIAGRTRNVSRGGLCAELPVPLTIGSELRVEVQLVFDADLRSEPLHLRGRVAWCTALDARFQVGIAFVAVDAIAAEDVRLFLRFLERGADVRKQRGAMAVDDRFR